MNRKALLVSLAVVLLALASAAPSLAETFNLRAAATTLTMPDGAAVPMWGFALEGGPVTVPGPVLEVPAGDSTLTINLTNQLPVPVSIVIPGQPATLSPVRFTDPQGRQRVRSFTAECAPGTTRAYTWTGLKPGSYLYQSGTHPAVQVQMGLYGCLKHDADAYLAYDGVPYQRDVVVVWSEIDPALHQAVATDNYGPGREVTSTLDYRPQYFLVNGEPYWLGQTPLPAVNLGERVLLRLLNAGLEAHVPHLPGLHLSVVAEDGNPYPYPREHYAPLLAAGKTLDAVVTPGLPGAYPLYDRRLFLTTAGASPGGMLTYLEVTSLPGTPVAWDDDYNFVEDGGTLSVAAPGVLLNDLGAASATLVSTTGAGLLSLSADGSFDYTPNPDFSGTDVFTYVAVNGGLQSNVATVAISVAAVNDAPMAMDDAATTDEGVALTIDVLANDHDIDGDTLSVAAATNGANGIVTSNPDNTVTYTPNPGFAGPDAFTYTVSDGQGGTATATVSVTVIAGPNEPPVAVDDSATTRRNTPVIINVLANDHDPDGTLDPATVGVVVTPRRGGQATPNPDGTITFSPRRNFRGTDVFTYTVKDNEGAASNAATVRVNVVR